MGRTRGLYLFSVIQFLLFFSWCEISYGNDILPTERTSLIDTYLETKKELEKSPLPIPFYLRSAVSSDASQVDIYGTMEFPFFIVENELLLPSNWCDILLLHDFVRACTYRKVNGTWLLAVYYVNRFNDPLENAYQLKFEFQNIAQYPGFFDISLAAPDGPFGTKDHRFKIEAIPVEDGKLFVHLRYSYHYGSLAYFAMKNYFSIFSTGKVGFSIIGTDREGNPVYVDGLRGAIERNVVRYYLAILAYMDTLHVPVEQRFEKRIDDWYDLTARFKQLFEMQKEEYLTFKRQDQKNQQMLQGALSK